MINCSSVRALDNGLAQTPPMGWNSWYVFYSEGASEYLAKDIAEAMINSGMRELGYEYVNIDDGWPAPNHDGQGHPYPNPNNFPNGIKHLADYLHSRGLKFGIYQSIRATTCVALLPGILGYEQWWANQCAAWGADFVFLDFGNQTTYTQMRDYLASTSRPMVYFTYTFDGFPGSWIVDVANMWRTCKDINDTWNRILSMIDENNNYASYAGPGHWNYPDAMVVGKKGLTLTEHKSHFSMWAIMAAPLITSTDLRNMSQEIKDILVAPEIIAVNQDSLGIQGTKVKAYGEQEVWMKPLHDGMKAVALFNRSSTAANITVNWTDIGLSSGAAEVRDLWARQDLGSFTDKYTANVSSHGTKVIRIIQGGPSTNTASYAPNLLQCESQIDPDSALTLAPWLRWQFRDPDVGDLQSAYQILVADNLTDINNSTGNIWDPGKKDSLNWFIKYSGPILNAGTRYYWKVRTWDQSDAASPYSAYGTFVPRPIANNAPAAPTGLKVEGQTNPVNITGYPPDFSWTFNDPDGGSYQSACQILVADNQTDINNDSGSLWDSKKEYSRANGVVYGGTGMISGKTYYWKVMTWDDNYQASPYSAIGSFSMTDAPGANVLLDPGFESNGYGWVGVTFMGRSIDTSVAHSGTKSQEIVYSSSWPREVYQDAAVITGGPYNAGGWIKTNSNSGNSSIILIWLDTLLNGNENMPSTAIKRTDTIGSMTGTNNWNYFSKQYAAPSNAKSVRFCLLASVGSGTAWFDDNELMDLSSMGSPKTGDKDLGNKPANVFIFPNPCTSETIIFFPTSYNHIITKIFDIHGQVVDSFHTFQKKSITWRADGVAMGIYIVDVRIADTHYRNRILLQRK